MKIKQFLGIVAILSIIWLIMSKVKLFSAPTNPVKRRKGVGDFGAYRSAHPTIPHRGQDYIAAPGQEVFAPISGVVRIGLPYPSDPRFQLVEIKSGINAVKVMYTSPTVKNGDIVKAGDLIGYVQDLSIKYGQSFLPQNHLHIEVRVNGQLKNPDSYFPKDSQKPILV